MGYDINGVGGIGGGQDAYAPPSGQASNTDISKFEQEIAALLQELQARDAGSGGGSGQPTAPQASGGAQDSGGGGSAPSGGAASGVPASSSLAAGGEQGQNTTQILEQVAEALLQALESRNGAQGAGGGMGSAPAGGAPAGGAPGGGGMPGGAPAQAATAQMPTGPDGTAPGGGGAAGQGAAGQGAAGQGSPGSTQQASAGGGTTSVDGAKPGGDTVSMQVVNNSGKDEKVALTNSQNQTFAEADLKPGQKETFLLDPNDPNTKSARMQTTDPNGSLRQDAKLTEFNLQPGHTAINVSNNNFAGITGTDGHAVDSEQMKINDNAGKVAGDGATNGAYRNSVDDANAMIMGDDPSKNYTVTIG